MQLLLISQLVIRQKQNRVPIYCANRKNIDIFIILLIGFGSRFMLCFSPTVWVSGNRTALFFYFSMIIASCLLISRYHHRIKNLDYFMAIFGVFAFCNIINCLV